MFVKKVQIEFSFSVFFTFSMLVVTEIGTDSFKGNIFLIVGLFLFPNNKSFWYFCLACSTFLFYKFLSLL